ncbi:MAG: hypothetical protein RL132_663, partial [Pseudomonadota bacterium]
FPQPVKVADVAANIGAGLAKAAIAGRVNGALVDTSFLIEHDSQLSIVTERDADGLEIIRHSTAHLLAYAAQKLFPGLQVTIGPVIENGFYYDFAYERPLTPEDLESIEATMRALAAKDEPIVREVWNRDEAVNLFLQMGEKYKAEIIGSIPADQPISLYREGDFVDLCRGPHVPSTGKLKVFKLMKVAGAYWRGDHRNEMLQRVYGTAFAKKDELDTYLHQLEEAEKRDHRKLGKALDLFHMQDNAPGMVFWHPKGWSIWQQVEQYLRQVYVESGYQEVRCPQILDRSLWEASGHWEHYKDNMFTTASENRDYAVKPMNCPGHIQVFNSGLRSYRDLPLRYGEFGSCHRNESSGSLHGLLFCTEDQIQSEVDAFTRKLLAVYRDFGFESVIYRLSTRPVNRVGSDESWDKAERALAEALNNVGVQWQELKGEGAFYGPKIEYSLKDSLGRIWQCGTIQVDFNMPVRLHAEFVDSDNTRKSPVMLHRAIVGSLERFIGILIENFAGAMPVWLAPVQAVVASITDSQADYAQSVAKTLQNRGFRVQADLRSEKISLKIRELSLQKVPYILVVGDKEKASGQVTVRARGGTDLGAMAADAFGQRLEQEVQSRQ